MKKKAREILSLAGVEIGGNEPWDIEINDERFYRRVFGSGSLGLGESYMDGWWDCKRLDEFFYRIFKAELESKFSKKSMVRHSLRSNLLNLQNPKRAFNIGKRHYDIGNDLYIEMLDKRLVYTCGYWKKARNLDEAQERKLDLVCKKIGLKRGMKVLDIGCGWGSFAKYASENYGVSVVGITVSKEQVKLGRKLCKGLPVEIRFQDYRDLNEKFDAVVSLGMFEHVGIKNYETYFKKVYEYLDDGGIFLLQTIGRNFSGKLNDRWIEKYIFPNSILPSARQITEASEGLLIMEDWHNFGTDYYKTLMAWYKNFNKNWEKISGNYDERFRRMWNYYLLISAGGFKSRKNQLWQIVFSKKGVSGGYESIR